MTEIPILCKDTIWKKGVFHISSLRSQIEFGERARQSVPDGLFRATPTMHRRRRRLPTFDTEAVVLDKTHEFTCNTCSFSWKETMYPISILQNYCGKRSRKVNIAPQNVPCMFCKERASSKAPQKTESTSGRRKRLNRRRKRKMKQWNAEHDQRVCLQNNPFLLLENILKENSSYRSFEDVLVPGYDREKRDASSFKGSSSGATLSISKVKRKTKEYARILEKRRREKEQMRQRIEASRSLKACSFYLRGQCSRGARCIFRHDERDLETSRTTPTSRTTTACRFFVLGRCTRGEDCTFSHDVSEGTEAIAREEMATRLAQSKGESPDDGIGTLSLDFTALKRARKACGGAEAI